MFTMKMLMHTKFPHEPFNTLLKEGKASETIRRILEDLKPESIYFTEQSGTRGAIAVIDVANSSRIPFFPEPFFINFNADCEFRIAMSPEDLGQYGPDVSGRGVNFYWKIRIRAG